jgi:hypothetical protein
MSNYDKVLEKFSTLTKKKQVDVLFSAIDYMNQYNGRTTNDCIVLAMAKDYETGMKFINENC